MSYGDAVIATAHWDACDSCANYDPAVGCPLPHVDVSVIDGDLIQCDQYRVIAAEEEAS